MGNQVKQRKSDRVMACETYITYRVVCGGIHCDEKPRHDCRLSLNLVFLSETSRLLCGLEGATCTVRVRELPPGTVLTH